MPPAEVNIETFVLGPLQTNGYVLWTGEECWAVDVGGPAGALLEFLGRRKLSPTRVLLTHGHADHIAGLGELKAAVPSVRVCCPEGDAAMLTGAELNLSADFGQELIAPPADELVRPGQTLLLGKTHWQVLDTSGHTPGGVSYYCPRQRVVITGDALFAGSIGRTDLPGASDWRLLKNIRTNLLVLPDETVVLPGHGPATTIERERKYNPFLGNLWSP